MKLKQFKERKLKKIGMIVGISNIVLLLDAIIIYHTYSTYQEKQEFSDYRKFVDINNINK